MAWSVNDIYELTKKLMRKNQAGSVSASDLFYMWNTEQNMYYSDIVGRWQARANGKQGANTGLIENETILTDLAPFTIPVTLTVTNGVATKPSDFIYRLALRIVVEGSDNGVDAFKINHNQIANVNASVIDPPSVPNNKYYFVEYEDYYKFLPTTVTLAELDYLASCTDIKWGFTLDANNRQVYNSGTSVQPKWDTPTIIEITKRVLTNFGVSFKDQDFLNYGRTAQATGN